MDLDEAFLAVGEFGSYQKRLTGLLVLLQVYVACQSMLIVIVGAVPEYHIDNEEDLSDEDFIKHVRYANNFTSIVSEWNLIKHEAYKVNLASSLLFAGLLIGNILFGPLSDKLGRRPVYLIGLLFDVIFGYLTALAPSYGLFAASRLFVGIMNGGMALVSFVLTQEYVGKSYWALTVWNQSRLPTSIAEVGTWKFLKDGEPRFLMTDRGPEKNPDSSSSTTDPQREKVSLEIHYRDCLEPCEAERSLISTSEGVTCDVPIHIPQPTRLKWKVKLGSHFVLFCFFCSS